MNKRFLPLSILVFIVGCTTNDPYSGDQKTSNATTGAIIGTVAGAAIGAATAGGNKKKSIATGAIAGAALGGGIGYYMDRQEQKLRRELQGTGVQVKRNGDTLTLIMPGNITFDTGKSFLKTQFHPVLNSVVKVLNEFDKTSIQVSGHTDSTGSADLNQVLSENRATSVSSYLLNRGVSVGRIHSVGYGKRYPIATNNTVEGRQANRRVELQLKPL